jgi:uncharacterized protein (DUF2461 family)
VDHDELLRRLDMHMARGNVIMARSNVLMEQNRRAFAANERAFRELHSFLGDLTQALRVLTEEFSSEMRAQRQALFRILDRLDGNGGKGEAAAG